MTSSSRVTSPPYFIGFCTPRSPDKVPAGEETSRVATEISGTSPKSFTTTLFAPAIALMAVALTVASCVSKQSCTAPCLTPQDMVHSTKVSTINFATWLALAVAVPAVSSTIASRRPLISLSSVVIFRSSTAVALAQAKPLHASKPTLFLWALGPHLTSYPFTTTPPWQA